MAEKRLTTTEATTPEELIDSLLATEDALVFVPRKLLIEMIGPEEASNFLQALPTHVSVNRAKLLLTTRLVKPELLKDKV